MPITPNRIIQTSTEAKKQYKKNGAALPAQQQKQLQRGLELDERAARFRESEERRKAAKKKREEKEAKEERARQQMGVGRATQMIGYSHTQAQLKNKMEAFLGVNKRREDERRKKDMELADRLESIVQEIEKEPWDDDEADDIALNWTAVNSSLGQQWIDEELDDDSLLQAHDLVMSDPVEVAPVIAQMPPAAAPPPRPAIAPTSPLHVLTKGDPNFVRTHGPKNKTVEAILDKLPEEVIELLSEDISMNSSHWDPAPGLLHKLNPVGLPPHRLRIKVGCIVTLLRDFYNSTQLSKSQYLRILRASNDRLECIVLDGQLQGTKTILTRVSFPAKYRNQEGYPFQRTQFPIRVAIDYKPASVIQSTAQPGCGLPNRPCHMPVQSVSKRMAPSIMSTKPQTPHTPGFKVPGLPASKSAFGLPPVSTHVSITTAKPYIPTAMLEDWDDFIGSSTQIARELSVDEEQSAVTPFVKAGTSAQEANMMLPVSTQDLNFSMDDLDNDESSIPVLTESLLKVAEVEVRPVETGPKDSLEGERDSASRLPLASRPNPPAEPRGRKSSGAQPKIAGRPKRRNDSALLIDLKNLRPSQRPPSVGDRPGLKRKKIRTCDAPPAKRTCTPASRPDLPAKSENSTKSHSIDDFRMSTQDAASFFDGMDDFEL
ncbi:hypothetical protein LEMA_P069050.1 [Plenodomus lingam JN3]|uniref:DNA helicase n=1 Tax=Leptosphaeria maculans (strain JN3 / isolate v23.1.3 / race Av1-4-5-6-7-8) TaxID=985895 RepID=E4ZJW2_LEPMJ|nr:hypothetical protein LEMA_P069050.1 [Plenodomus lingam JN3]CBX91397.1 hypothetical protein LEMA_P069050.1 [Plenodomus lingam JN3]